MKSIYGGLAVIILLIIGGFSLQKTFQKQTVKQEVKKIMSPIRIAYPSAGTIISGQIGLILQKKDILKTNNLDAKVLPMATGKEMKTALVANQVDAILTSESNFIVLLGQGFEGYAISTLGADGKMALVVNAESSIKTVADLKGMKVGTLFGTSVHKPAIEWVKAEGLIPGTDVEIVNLGGAEALRTALVANKVDAIVLWDPYLTDGVNKKLYRTLKSADLDLITIISKVYANKNPAAVKDFVNAQKEAVFYLTQNKQEIAALYAKMAKIDEPLVSQTSTLNKNYSVTKMSDIDLTISNRLKEKLVSQAEFFYNEKLIEKKPEVLPFIKN